MQDVRTIGDVVARAQESLSDELVVFAESGAGNELTVARNLAALRSLALVPSVLGGVATIDTSTSLFGVPMSFPVMLSPVGALDLYDPDGSAASAVAAASVGTISCVGILSAPSLEEVAERAGNKHLFFQMYPDGDEKWIRAMLDRVEQAGYRAICLTSDRPVKARSDRLLSRGFDWYATRPAPAPNLVDVGHDRLRRASFTWKDLEKLRSMTSLPIAVKGIMRAADAVRAVDLGIDGIYVSNHGGRAMDHGLSSIEALTDIVGVVGDRAEVMIDSGFRSGADVCKAVALGAKAVLIGRLQCWGLALGGAEGVARVLEILKAEVTGTMAMLGCRTVADLGRARSQVRPAVPV